MISPQRRPQARQAHFGSRASPHARQPPKTISPRRARARPRSFGYPKTSFATFALSQPGQRSGTSASITRPPLTPSILDPTQRPRSPGWLAAELVSKEPRQSVRLCYNPVRMLRNARNLVRFYRVQLVHELPFELPDLGDEPHIPGMVHPARTLGDFEAQTRARPCSVG